MRIIKAATRAYEVQVECAECHSILGVNRADVSYNSGKQCYTIKCPVCEQYVGVKPPDKLFPWTIENEEEMNEDKKNEHY